MIIGIDPGAMGAIAVLDNGSIFGIYDMPIMLIRRGKTDKKIVDGYALRTLPITMADVLAAYIEQVGGIPGQSASAAFNFGRSAGIPEGWLKCNGVRVEEVPPGTWKRALKVNGGKDGARAMASRLWPDSAHLFKRVKDDGRAEAALIAEYGRRQLETSAPIQQKGLVNVFE